jgi:galactose mutarotase-like enzyme
LPWDVDPSAEEFTLMLYSNEQTRAVYPFDFQLAFTYKIQGNILEIQQEYTNLSSEPMPFSAGFHPYFAIADKNQLELSIPAQSYQNQITKEIHPFNGTLDFNVDEIDVAFKQITASSAAATDRDRHLQLILESDRIFSTLVFWTVKGKDYYCLEPWTAPRNAINTGEKLTILEPQATCSTNIRLTANFSPTPLQNHGS